MNNEDLDKLAHLARLKIKEEERENLKHSLNEILNFVERLNTAEIVDVAPLAHPSDMYQRLRSDQVDERDVSDRLQKISPESRDGFYTVPKVLD